MPLAAVPSDWMPDAPMTRIHVHWTGGSYLANKTDLNAYHILIEGNGRVVRGNKSIAANAPGSALKAASHTLGANTGAIGVSMCCMAGAVEKPFSAGRYPTTRAQWDNAMEVIAILARRYEIPVTPITILTHAEVEPNLGIRQKNKWDIVCLAFDDSIAVGCQQIGRLMRLKIAQILDTDAQSAKFNKFPTDMRLPKFRVTGVAPSSLNFRDAPNGSKKGELHEGALVERLAIDGHWSRIRTTNGFIGWVFSDFLRVS